MLIVETNGGWVCANAGIDASNVPGTDMVTLLPLDADASAREMRTQLGSEPALRPAVVVADSFGRPWRLGQAEVAIGCAGVVARRLAGAHRRAGPRARRHGGRGRRPARRRRRPRADQGFGQPGGADSWCRAVVDGGRWARSRSPAAPRRPRPVPLVAQLEALEVVLAPTGSGAPSSVNSGATYGSPGEPPTASTRAGSAPVMILRFSAGPTRIQIPARARSPPRPRPRPGASPAPRAACRPLPGGRGPGRGRGSR